MSKIEVTDEMVERALTAWTSETRSRETAMRAALEAVLAASAQEAGVEDNEDDARTARIREARALSLTYAISPSARRVIQWLLGELEEADRARAERTREVLLGGVARHKAARKVQS
jgi:hypothetical protein